MKQKFKAICFDVDGVLIDAVDWHFETFNAALKLFGYSVSKELHDAALNGLPTTVKLERLSHNYALPFYLHEFIKEMKQKYTLEYVEKFCKPDYEKLLMLKKLRDDGVRLACCSNAKQKTVKLMLSKAGLLDFFWVILGNESVEKPKPDPEIYLKAFNLLGVKPEDTAIVEDSEHGKRAAQLSGAYLIPVKGYTDVNLSLFYT